MEQVEYKFSKKEIKGKIDGFLNSCTRSIKSDNPDSYSVAKLLPVLKEYLIETEGLLDRAEGTLRRYLKECKQEKLRRDNSSSLVLTPMGEHYKQLAAQESEFSPIPVVPEDANFPWGESASRLVRNLEKQGYEVRTEITDSLDGLDEFEELDFDFNACDMGESSEQLLVGHDESEDNQNGLDTLSLLGSLTDTELNDEEKEDASPSISEWLLDMDSKTYILGSANEGIDKDIQKQLSSLSYDMVEQGSIVSFNSEFIDFLKDKQQHFNALMNDIESIRRMLEDGSCYDKNGVLPLVQFEGQVDMSDIGSDDTAEPDKNKIVRNGNPFKRGPRKKPYIHHNTLSSPERTTEEIEKMARYLKTIEDEAKHRKEVKLLGYLDTMGKQSDLSEVDDPENYGKVVECLKELDRLL